MFLLKNFFFIGSIQYVHVCVPPRDYLFLSHIPFFMCLKIEISKFSAFNLPKLIGERFQQTIHIVPCENIRIGREWMAVFVSKRKEFEKKIKGIAAEWAQAEGG